jgi:threonine aldolase
MGFMSDNTAPVHPSVLAALTHEGASGGAAYGLDYQTEKLQQKLCSLFETEVTLFCVPTGTAANALALATLCPPYGAVICHSNAHINIDECGAPEFFTAGAKLIATGGEQAKMTCTELDKALHSVEKGFVHHVQPSVLSLSQTTELGGVYTIDEVRALASMAKANGLAVHMDGARFANAVAALDVAPAEMTWKAGVDVLSFGMTKNGAMAAEAVVFFNADKAKGFDYRQKRGGHLLSKSRLIAAQFNACLKDGLWLDNARTANRAAKKLVDAFNSFENAEPVFSNPQANEIFIAMPVAAIDALEQAGHSFYRWHELGNNVIRLVTNFATTDEEVEAFVADVRKIL